MYQFYSLIIILSCFVTSGYSQLSLSVMGSINYNSAIFNTDNEFNPIIFPFADVALEYNISSKWNMGIDIAYGGRGYSIKGNIAAPSTNIKYNYTTFTQQCSYLFSDKFRFETGIQFAVKTSAKFKEAENAWQDIVFDLSKSTYIGAILSLNYHYNKKLFTKLSYERGISPFSKTEIVDINGNLIETEKAYFQGIKLGVGYIIF
jgi:hypothetical protein